MIQLILKNQNQQVSKYFTLLKYSSFLNPYESFNFYVNIKILIIIIKIIQWPYFLIIYVQVISIINLINFHLHNIPLLNMVYRYQ